MVFSVQKFGGTSVGTPELIRDVADHIKRCKKNGGDVALVISAMGKETDDLLDMANKISTIQPGREMDMLITAGERKSVALMCMALTEVGVPAESFTGSQAGFLTDTNHRNAKILEITPGRIQQAIDEGKVPVVAGAQGVSTDKNVTFLGRGGSDTTAVALAHAMGADICELYTDVSGVYSADPRIVLKAQQMQTITFHELLEMTATGCPKPALRAVEYAYSHNVPLHIRSAFTWMPGTLVIGEDEDMEQAVVRAVTHDNSRAKVTVVNAQDTPGVSAKLFETIADANLEVDIIVQNISSEGHVDVSFTVEDDDIEAVKACLNDDLIKELGADNIRLDGTSGVVSLTGAGMKTNPGVAAKMFKTLGEAGINIEMISTSPIRISCVVNQDQTEEAVRILHTAFGLDAS